MVVTLAVVGDIIPPRDRGRYQGFFGGVFGVSTVIGPLLGGFFVDSLSWRWIFYVNLPVGALAFAAIALTFQARTERVQHQIDFAGAAALAGALASLVLFTSLGGTTYAWGSPWMIALVVAGAVSLAAFVFVEARAPEPILPLSLFRTRVISVVFPANILIGAAMFGVIIYIPLFVQGVLGASATNSGVVLIPLMLAVVAAVVTSGRIVTHTGRYKIFPISGTLTCLVGFWLLTRLNVGSTRLDTTIAMIVVGLGIGQIMQTYTLAVQNAVPRTQLGVATASTQFFRSIGGAFGVAVLGSILISRLTGQLVARLGPGARAIDPESLLQPGRHISPDTMAAVRDGLATSLHTVFMAGLPVMGLALVCAFLLKEVPLRSVSYVSAASEAAVEAGQAGPAGNGALSAAASRPSERSSSGRRGGARSRTGS
jgi:MFS family permease